MIPQVSFSLLTTNKKQLRGLAPGLKKANLCQPGIELWLLAPLFNELANQAQAYWHWTTKFLYSCSKKQDYSKHKRILLSIDINMHKLKTLGDRCA
jgi:hypothetical protein